jgi:hypothetical protein
MDSRDVSMIAREVARLHLLCARFTVLLVSSLLLVPVARVSAQEATPEAPQ